jgi:hypothetical protein
MLPWNCQVKVLANYNRSCFGRHARVILLSMKGMTIALPRDEIEH